MDETNPTGVAAGQIKTDGEAIAQAGKPSWMEELRRKRDERVSVEVLKMGMPTWGEDDKYDMVVEFGVVDREVLERFQRDARSQARKSKTGASDIDMAFLATAVRAIYLRSPETDSLVKLEKPEGVPVKFDKRLAEMLGLDPTAEGKDHRTILNYLVKNNGVALGTLANKVATWMGDTSRMVDGEVLGE